MDDLSAILRQMLMQRPPMMDMQDPTQQPQTMTPMRGPSATPDSTLGKYSQLLFSKSPSEGAMKMLPTIAGK